MVSQHTAALVYFWAMLPPMVVQIFLVFGASLGHLTMGGIYSGRLPAKARALCGLQIAIQLLMLWIVLSHAEVQNGLESLPTPPSWSIWGVLGVTSLSCIANWATPSLWERRLWGPITTVLLASVLGVIIF